MGSYVRHPTSDVLHPTSYIPHPTFYILHPTSCILHPTSYILHPASCILDPTSYILHDDKRREKTREDIEGTAAKQRCYPTRFHKLTKGLLGTTKAAAKRHKADLPAGMK